MGINPSAHEEHLSAVRWVNIIDPTDAVCVSRGYGGAIVYFANRLTALSNQPHHYQKRAISRHGRSMAIAMDEMVMMPKEALHLNHAIGPKTICHVLRGRRYNLIKTS